MGFFQEFKDYIIDKRKSVIDEMEDAKERADEMLKNDITVAIGSDNIHDIYKPFSDGNMFTELKFLLD